MKAPRHQPGSEVLREGRARIASVQRLANLPEIFTAHDVIARAAVDPGRIDQLMWRWSMSGLVQSLGGRAEVWFNLVKRGDIDRHRWERAVRMALPQVVVAGHALLMRAGVTTQMSSTEYLLRPARSKSCEVHGAQLHERPAVWMRRLHEAGAIDFSGVLPELRVGAAIADLDVHEPGVIDGDIDWDDIDPEQRALYDHLLDCVVDRRPTPILVKRSCDTA